MKILSVFYVKLLTHQQTEKRLVKRGLLDGDNKN